MTKKANKDTEQQKRQAGSFAKQVVGLTTAVSAEIAVMTVCGYYGGSFMDGKFGTAPWLMLLGVVLGLAVGFAVIIKTLKRFL